MAPGGKAFIIFNFPPGVSLFATEEFDVICCARADGPARRAYLACVSGGVVFCLTATGDRAHPIIAESDAGISTSGAP